MTLGLGPIKVLLGPIRVHLGLVRVFMGPILVLLHPIIKGVAQSSVPTPPIPRWKATPLLLQIVGITTNYHNISADITYTFFCLKLNPSQSKNKLELKLKCQNHSTST